MALRVIWIWQTELLWDLQGEAAGLMVCQHHSFSYVNHFFGCNYKGSGASLHLFPSAGFYLSHFLKTHKKTKAGYFSDCHCVLLWSWFGNLNCWKTEIGVNYRCIPYHWGSIIHNAIFLINRLVRAEFWDLVLNYNGFIGIMTVLWISFFPSLLLEQWIYSITCLFKFDYSGWHLLCQKRSSFRVEERNEMGFICTSGCQ